MNLHSISFPYEREASYLLFSFSPFPFFKFFLLIYYRPLPPEPFQEAWDDTEEMIDDVLEEVEDKSIIADISKVQIFNLTGLHIMDQINYVRFFFNPHN